VRLQAEKLLVTGNLTAVQEEAVQMQLEELARLSRIIEELLFLSRAEARAISLELEPQDPLRFLHVFAQDARVLAEHHGRHFVLTREGEGTAAFEAKRVRQVLLNLLANALDASPPDGVITLHSSLRDGVWRVLIEDQGIGVPADQRERIFERFVRLDNHGDDNRGSGLGLAICRSIIALHHGYIWAEAGSNGVGLRVVFEIPATGTSTDTTKHSSVSERSSAMPV
jgi:two-component system heavy metal sensor histidine kinase CusS